MPITTTTVDDINRKLASSDIKMLACDNGDFKRATRIDTKTTKSISKNRLLAECAYLDAVTRDSDPKDIVAENYARSCSCKIVKVTIGSLARIVDKILPVGTRVDTGMMGSSF